MVYRATKDINIDKSKTRKNKYVPNFLKMVPVLLAVCVFVCARVCVYVCVLHLRQTETVSCSGCCSTNTEWMSDKGLLLWLPVKQELIMKSFQRINSFL